jgi:hypothetical protein
MIPAHQHSLCSEKKMKKICAAVFLAAMAAKSAAAAWPEDFIEDFDKLGLDRAVENALDNKISPHEILTVIISGNKKFDLRLSLKALYCAGVEREDVREAADKLGITIEELSKALEESIAECGSRLALSDREVFFPNESGALSPTTAEEPPSEPEPDPRQLLQPPKSVPAQPASPSTPSHIQ